MGDHHRAELQFGVQAERPLEGIDAFKSTAATVWPSAPRRIDGLYVRVLQETPLPRPKKTPVPRLLPARLTLLSAVRAAYPPNGWVLGGNPCAALAAPEVLWFFEDAGVSASTAVLDQRGTLRTIAIGLDGSSWNVLGPLLDTGELPNLAELRERGSHGVLESTVPFFTGPAWASFATGASPAAHGIYDFMMLRDGGRLSVAGQDDLRRLTYFQHLGRQEQPSVIVNMPLDQTGSDHTVIVNSWLTDAESRRILPVGRRERYRTLLESYKTFPTNTGDVDELCALEQARFDLARELFLAEPWEHFFILFSSTDWLGHSATGAFLAGDAAARTAFLRLYRQLDAYIGWMIERAADAAVVVMSDHGQTEETAVVRVNAVLKDLGLLETGESPPSDNPFFVMKHEEPVRRRIDVPPTLGRLRKNRFIGPTALALKRAMRRGFNIEVTRARQTVDFARSSAFSPTDASFAIYTRNGGGERIDEIREALLAIRLDDGRRALDDVWLPEEIYGREADPNGPSLLFSPADGVRPSSLIKEAVVGLPRERGRGCHQRDGIVLFGGPSVASTDLGRASIYDVAPTLLWLMGSSIPAGGDGRVLFEAFDPGLVEAMPVSEVEADPFVPAGPYADDGGADVTERLRALGYI